jgi:ADP-heptose:LPS heptosyltransferase
VTEPGFWKRAEYRWRALWVRLLVRAMRTPGSARPAWGSRPHRVLFLRHDRAGDMILSTGVMRAIATSHATIELDVLASPANAEILVGAPYVRRTVVFDKRSARSYLSTIATLRRARYDAVIDCMVTAPSVTTLLLMAATGAPFRIGIAGRGNDAAVNVRVDGANDDAHMVDKLARLASAFDLPAGGDSRGWSPVLTPSDDELNFAHAEWDAAGRRPRVLVNISAGTAERRWPDDRYAAVIRHVREHVPSAAPLLISAPADRERAAAIGVAAGAPVTRARTLREALARVATADVVITPDTSIAHAASAFQRPCVGLYSTRKAGVWGLYRTPGEMVIYDGDTIDALLVAPVIAALDRVLADRAPK